MSDMHHLDMFSIRNFKKEFACYSVAMMPGHDRQDVETGGKIILPPSALDQLTRAYVEYPMLFKLTNERMNRVSHSGVLEFTADEGKVYLPHWMMNNLMLAEGDTLEVEYKQLPVATFSRFQPLAEDFLDIHNPKAVLENTLRKFACLTAGDIININYNERNYELSVLETKPKDAVNIIECDMNVDFAPPLGYKEPGNTEPAKEGEDTVDDTIDNTIFVPFSGEGQRVDGKKKTQSETEPEKRKIPVRRGIPDYNWKVGTLVFMRNQKPSTPAVEETTEPSFQPFQGKGYSMYD